MSQINMTFLKFTISRLTVEALDKGILENQDPGP